MITRRKNKLFSREHNLKLEKKISSVNDDVRPAELISDGSERVAVVVHHDDG